MCIRDSLGTADSRGRWRRRFPPTFDHLARGWTSVSVTPLSGLRCTRIKHCHLHTSHICLYKLKKKKMRNEKQLIGKWSTVQICYWLDFRNCIYHILSSSRFALLDLYMVRIFGLNIGFLSFYTNIFSFHIRQKNCSIILKQTLQICVKQECMLHV